MKRRILSGLLVGVMVLSMMTINVFATESSKELSNISYDYGVIPYSEKWNELTTSEKKSYIYYTSRDFKKPYYGGIIEKYAKESIYNRNFFI